MLTKTDQIFQTTSPYANIYQGDATRALFVCSAGLLRSATAATVGSQLGLNTRACGSEEYALVPLSANLINWAKWIYFVNPYNYNSALKTFASDEDLTDLIFTKAVVWDIPDDYNYMDPKLVDMIMQLLYNTN